MLKQDENQDIEFKESWRDEYIKWICGFANAKGGKIYIGVDDSGEIVGIDNYKKLLEDIPNKVRDLLGVIVDLSMLEEDGKYYLEIDVEPYPYPVSYKGQYHYRTGSSKQELKGAALDKFLLMKQGKKWDGVPVPNITTDDLSNSAIEVFKQKTLDKKRVEEDILDEDKDILIEKLHLKEGDYLKRASLLLFGKNIEKYVRGAYIKIGFFKSDSELIYQDKIDGTLIEQIDKVEELLFTKYLKAIIRYEGTQRIEEFPISNLAFREAVLNAIVHKDYGELIPIQINVYEDKLLIWNCGELPNGWDTDTLQKKHPSKPFNPDIANVFFLAGLIESWGTGIDKIINESKKFNDVIPSFKIDNGLWIEFKFNQLGDRLGDRLGEKFYKLSENRKIILKSIFENATVTISELSKIASISTTAIENNLKYLKENNLLKRVGSDSSGSWEIVYEI